MSLVKALKKTFKANKETSVLIAKAGGTSTECSEGYHKHSDKYSGHCHNIAIKHRKKGDEPHKGNPTGKKGPIKKLHVKEST